MGSMTQKLKEVTGQSEDEKIIKERLELLLLAAKAKIRGYRDEINEGFMNPGQVDKIQIPGNRAIRYIEQYHVAAQDGFSQQVGDHLTHAIDSFFSIGGKDQDTKAAVQDGVKSLISVALDAFIGSTEAGESEEKIYIVIPENNAFVRVDIACWKYHLTSSKVVDSSDTAVAYLLCKSVIDHTKITIDELIYLVSETLNQKGGSAALPTVEKEIQPLKADGKTIDSTRTIKRKFIADPADLSKPKKVDPGKPDDFLNWIEAPDFVSGGEPPNITAVEAYLEEIIRVWNKLKADRQ